VDQRPVTDRDMISNGGRVCAGHRVNDRPVLNIRAPADPDPIDIATDDRAHPDTALLSDLDVPDHLRTVVDERGGMDKGRHAPERTEHSGDYSGQNARDRLLVQNLYLNDT
jgi:hypothetical protein